jgi:cGMP-dependent protein kinase 1
MDHDFMRNLDVDQLNSIIDCMYPIYYEKDSLIIEEGDIGQLLYLIEGIF